MGSITETATAFPGQTGQRPEQRRAAGRDAAAQRLQHRRLRQVARDRRLGGQPVRPDRPLADPLRASTSSTASSAARRTSGRRRIYEGMNQVELPKDPNYHFMTDMTNQAIKWIECPEIADAGQAVLHLLRPGRHARPAPRAEGVDRQVQGQVRPGLGQAPRGDARPPDQARRRPAGHQARPQARGHQGLGQADAPTRRGSSPARWRSSPASASTPTTRSAGSSRPSKTSARWTTRSIFYIVGDNGASAEGDHERPVQRDDLLQRRARNRRGHPQALRRAGRPELLPPLRRRAGPWPATRRSPGRSRSPAATAAPATAWSSTGPRGSRPRARSARSGITSSTSRRPSSKRPACPSRRSVNGTPQTPIEGVSMVYTFDDAKAKDRHKTQYFEIFGNRGIYHDGWLAHTVHRAAWEMQAAAPVPRRQVGTLPRRGGLQLGERPGREEPREAQGAAGPLPEGSGQVPRAAARRPRHRAHQRRPRRAARPDGRPHVADGLRGHDRDDGERLHQHQEPVAHDHRRGRDPEGRRQRRDPLPRPAASAAGACTSRMASRRTPTTSSACSATRSPPTEAAARRARRRSASSSPTTAAAWARAARARSSSTARRSPKGEIDRTQANRLLGRRRRGRRPGRRDAGDERLQGTRQQVHRQDPQGDRRSAIANRFEQTDGREAHARVF